MDQSPPPIELRDHRWRHRLLLVFAPDPNDDALREQRRLLAGREDAMRERDLLLFEIVADGGRAENRDLPAPSAERLRRHFGVSAGDFAVLLVGKDGTVKRREAAATSPDDLFVQIDGMPMRRRELSEQED